MADAAYFHTTLYAFNADARAEVIKRLNSRIKDVSVRGWYDAAQDAFCILCPSAPTGPRGDGPPIGPLANSILGEVISQFIEEELKQGEDEGRHPRIHRFLESDIDVLDVVPDDIDLPLLPKSSPPEEVLASDNTHATGTGPILTRHFIKVKGGVTCKIKMFHLRDLPSGVLERTLTPDDRLWNTAIGVGLSPRVVRWDLEKERYVFSGRLGQAIQTKGSLETRYLELVKFKPFKNQKQPYIAAAQDYSEHAGNQPYLQHGASNVQQWRLGVENPEEADPNEMPVMPRETQNFVAQDTHGPLATVGRPRVPKIRAALHLIDFSEDSDEDSGGGPPIGMAFRDLLGGKGKDKSNHHQSSHGGLTCTTSTSTCGNSLHNDPRSVETSETTIPARPPQIRNYAPATCLAPNVTPPTTSEATYRAIMNRNIGSPSTQSTVTPPASSINDGTAQFSENTIPAYNRKYDAVDRIGLTITAQDQANHETANPSPPKAKGSRRGVVSRHMIQASQLRSPPSTEVQSTAMSMSTGIEPQAFRSPGRDRQLQRGSSSSRQGSLSDRGDWRNRVAARIVPQGNLIDVSAPPSGIVRPPPGLEFGPEDSTSTQQSSMANVTNSSYVRSQTAKNENISDKIAERLALESHNPRKYYTMRQKKGKKTYGGKKKNTAKTSQPQAQLEIPEPVPVRSALKSTDKNSRNGAETTPGTSATNQTQPAGRVAIFVQELKQFIELENNEIVVCFGLNLLWQQNDNYLKGVSDCTKLESRLRSAVAVQNQFNTRLTTSDADFEHLLDLLPGDYTAECLYDLRIKTTQGEHRSIIVNPEEPNHVAVFNNDSAVTYFMYPMHTFDARIAIRKVGVDDSLSKDDRSKLVDSLCLLGEGPVIRGLAESHAFSIDKVYAKRVFRKTKEGVTLSVSEVSELKMEALDPTAWDGFNFQASAPPREDMIKQNRLWFEAGLTSQDISNKGLSALEELVDEMVAKIDGVGHSSMGPWVRHEEPKVEDRSNKGWAMVSMW